MAWGSKFLHPADRPLAVLSRTPALASVSDSAVRESAGSVVAGAAALRFVFHAEARLAVRSKVKSSIDNSKVFMEQNRNV